MLKCWENKTFYYPLLFIPLKFSDVNLISTRMRQKRQAASGIAK